MALLNEFIVMTHQAHRRAAAVKGRLVDSGKRGEKLGRDHEPNYDRVVWTFFRTERGAGVPRIVSNQRFIMLRSETCLIALQ